jgi:choline dehydrogenase
MIETVFAEREIIVSAGAFNTPQLLKLSRIGPREELERHGIEVRQDTSGTVKLRSADARDVPEINLITFRKRTERKIESLITGVETVPNIIARSNDLVGRSDTRTKSRKP